MNKEEFLVKISKLSNEDKKTIIAIDGYSGAGKTTLLKELEKENKDVLAVFMDDFILTGKHRSESIRKSKDKSKVFELNWYDYEQIKELIQQFKVKDGGVFETKIYNPDASSHDISKEYDLSKRILVIEGIFLFHPKLFVNIFDIKAFIDIDLDKADERRVIREKKRWGKDYFPEDHPDSFTRLFKIAYRRYLKEYKPKEKADIVINLVDN